MVAADAPEAPARQPWRERLALVCWLAVVVASYDWWQANRHLARLEAEIARIARRSIDQEMAIRMAAIESGMHFSELKVRWVSMEGGDLNAHYRQLEAEGMPAPEGSYLPVEGDRYLHVRGIVENDGILYDRSVELNRAELVSHISSF